jgi:hypothetical protein
MTKLSEVLAEVKDGDAWRPLALLTAGGKGPFFPLPEITTVERSNVKVKTVTLTVAKKASKDKDAKEPEFEIVVHQELRFSTDMAGMNELLVRLTKLTLGGNLPAKIVPHGEMPLALLISLVDTCLKSRVQLEWMTLDPTAAVPPPAPAPAPAGEGEKK